MLSVTRDRPCYLDLVLDGVDDDGETWVAVRRDEADHAVVSRELTIRLAADALGWTVTVERAGDVRVLDTGCDRSEADFLARYVFGKFARKGRL